MPESDEKASCAAPAIGGPCVLTVGHNQGRADVPEAHRARLDNSHLRVLALIAERTDERSPDPGCTTSSATFADTYNVFVHWRTARALHARGLIDHPFKGGPDEGWSIALTEAGWEAVRDA